MKLARSTYYYRPCRTSAARNAVEKRIELLCAEFPRYGYRRITAQLSAADTGVNHKAVARVMREQGSRCGACDVSYDHRQPTRPSDLPQPGPHPLPKHFLS